MSERGKQDRIGLVVKIAGAVTAVAGAAAAVFALIPNDPSPPPPPAIRGEISEIETEPDVTLAAYQQRSPFQPKRCAHFESPPAASRKVAMAPGRPGRGSPLATASAAVRLAQSKVDVRAAQDKTTTEPEPSRPPGTGTTTTATTTTETTTTETTTATTPTSTTTTDTAPATRPTGLLQRPSTAALTLGGERSLKPSRTAMLLRSTRTKDPAATAAAIERIKSGDSAGKTALKREIADLADDLIGEVVSFRVRIIGLAGRCSYLRWSLYDAKTRPRAREPQLANRDALYFRPEAVDDFASSYVWVGLPPRKGPFFVRLELFKDEGSGLARANSPKFG